MQYNNQIVLLARDPHQLYAYWDISASEYERKKWGKSVPYLKVINITLNQSFFIKINDSDTHCFIPVTDANCTYTVEIGRKLSDQQFISLASAKPVYTPAKNVSGGTTAYFADYKDLSKGYIREGMPVIDEIYKNTIEQIVVGTSSESFMKG